MAIGFNFLIGLYTTFCQLAKEYQSLGLGIEVDLCCYFLFYGYKMATIFVVFATIFALVATKLQLFLLFFASMPTVILGLVCYFFFFFLIAKCYCFLLFFATIFSYNLRFNYAIFSFFIAAKWLLFFRYFFCSFCC